jgi:hypothetical protein
MSSGLLDSRANKCSGAGIGSVPDSDEVTAGPVIFSPDGSVVVDLRLTPCVVLMWYPQNMVEWKRPRHTPETVLRHVRIQIARHHDRWDGVCSRFVGYGRISEREMQSRSGRQRSARRPSLDLGNGPLLVSRCIGAA